MCEGPEKHKGPIRPYGADKALNLWGRDLLQQWGAELHIPSLSKTDKCLMFNSKFKKSHVPSNPFSFPNL